MRYKDMIDILNDWSANTNADKKERWTRNAQESGKCTLCPPHGGENLRRGKHGPKKPKKKDHR